MTTLAHSSDRLWANSPPSPPLRVVFIKYNNNLQQLTEALL